MLFGSSLVAFVTVLSLLHPKRHSKWLRAFTVLCIRSKTLNCSICLSLCQMRFLSKIESINTMASKNNIRTQCRHCLVTLIEYIMWNSGNLKTSFWISLISRTLQTCANQKHPKYRSAHRFSMHFYVSEADESVHEFSVYILRSQIVSYN